MDIFREAQAVRIIFIIIAIIAAAALVCFLVLFFKKRKEYKNEIKYFEKKLHKTMRNDVLNKAISNYSRNRTKNYWLIKIIEENQFGKSEHFYNLNDGDVSIGRDFKSNKLCIFDEDVDVIQCRVEMHKEIPYVVNVAEKVETTFLMKKKYKREFDKKHIMRVGESMRLFTSDAVQFGETTLHFYLYNNNMGIV